MKLYLIKIKNYNDYSINDLKNNTISFGRYSVFKDQRELVGIVDSKYLNEKYHDNSITDNNAVDFIANYLDEHYLQSSFCMLSDSVFSKEALKSMYKDYAIDGGFIEFFEFNDVQEIYKYFDGLYPCVCSVLYKDKAFDLTTFFDYFLATTDQSGTDDKKLNELLENSGHKDDLIDFMRTKVNYLKTYENEFRIIVQRNDSMKIVNDHTVLTFKKPNFINIPCSLDKKRAYEIIKNCKKNRILYKYLEL